MDRAIDVISILMVTALALFLQFDILWSFLAENNSLQEKLASATPLLFSLAALGILGLGLLYAFRKKIMESKFYQKNPYRFTRFCRRNKNNSTFR